MLALCLLFAHWFTNKKNWPICGRKTKRQLSLPATPYGTPHRQYTNCSTKWNDSDVSWGGTQCLCIQVQMESQKGDGEREEKMETRGRRQENDHTQHWGGGWGVGCIGLCCPEAEEESLTFPLLQAASETWFLFSLLWMQVNSDNEQDGEGRKQEERREAGHQLRRRIRPLRCHQPTADCQETNFLFSFRFNLPNASSVR